MILKRLILLVVFSFLFAGAYAQANTDSLTYQLQRKKINTMLEQRRQKFGQYDQSLKQHTGIFGLQTKKDIRRSNDILMDIVKTDNEIFVQLKILLDYRMSQQKEVQSHSMETEGNNLGFMNTINKLQVENARLRQEAELNTAKQEKSSQISMAIVIALIVVVLLLLRAKFAKK